MTRESVTRTVPITRLRQHYRRLGERGMSTGQRHAECKCLIADVTPLVDEFLEALGDLNGYDRREEPFYPDLRRRTITRRRKGATEVIGQLEGHPVSISNLPSYVFRIVDREINPLRTIGVRFPDGSPAPRKGRVGGGLDYVGLLKGTSPTPILGEIKACGDKDTYYAFVQLLTCLSELSTPAQLARANKHLFKGELRLQSPIRFDLHILLAGFNDKGKKGGITESTRELGEAFKTDLARRAGAGHTLGHVLCLRTTGPMDSIQMIWSA